MMHLLGLVVCKYFDTVLVDVKTFLLLYRLALAILCLIFSLIEAEFFLGKNNLVTIEDRYLLLCSLWRRVIFQYLSIFLCLYDWKIYSHRLQCQCLQCWQTVKMTLRACTLRYLINGQDLLIDQGGFFYILVLKTGSDKITY